jgi:hypothetical protein
MRRLLLALALVAAALTTAVAAHAAGADSFQGTIEILKGSKVLATYQSSMTACSTSSTLAAPCQAIVTMPNRDSLRVGRACGGANARTMQVFRTRTESCIGGYTARFTADVYDCSGDPCTEATAGSNGFWVQLVALAK